MIYRDDAGVLCRRFNWREAARTCLTPQTTNAVLIIEAIPPTTPETLQKALGDLQQLIQQYCGGSVRSEVLNEQNVQKDLDPPSVKQ